MISENVMIMTNAEFELYQLRAFHRGVERGKFEAGMQDSIPIRDTRQSCVANWVKSCFGESVFTDLQERVMRVLEEAIELAQSEHLDYSRALKLLDHVFKRDKGDPAQEAGGVLVTMLGYCAAKNFSAERIEHREFERIMSMPESHWVLRQKAKVSAGVAEQPSGKV